MNLSFHIERIGFLIYFYRKDVYKYISFGYNYLCNMISEGGRKQ